MTRDQTAPTLTDEQWGGVLPILNAGRMIAERDTLIAALEAERDELKAQLRQEKAAHAATSQMCGGF